MNSSNSARICQQIELIGQSFTKSSGVREIAAFHVMAKGANADGPYSLYSACREAVGTDKLYEGLPPMANELLSYDAINACKELRDHFGENWLAESLCEFAVNSRVCKPGTHAEWAARRLGEAEGCYRRAYAEHRADQLRSMTRRMTKLVNEMKGYPVPL